MIEQDFKKKIRLPGSTPFIVDTLISQSNTISKGAYPVLQGALKDFYREKSELMMPLSGLSNQARSFPIQAVSLAINANDLHEAPTNREEKKDKKSKQHSPLEFDSRLEREAAGHSIEKPIAIKDIFKSTDELKDKKNIQRVLIGGRAGVGKTTLVQFIAWQWAEDGLFNEYDYLLCVPLRKWLSGNSNAPTTFAEDLAEFLHPCFFPKETTTARLVELEAVLSSESSRTLLVLDGYDEVAHHLYLDSTYGQLLFQALQFKQVIVTTRDYQPPQADVVFDKTLINIGFTDAQIEEYVTRYIKWRGSSQTLDSKDDSKSNSSSSLIQALRRNPRLWRLSHTPFNLALICETQSWLPTKTEALGEFTLTALYEQMMKWFLLQQLQKQDQIPKLYDMNTLKREFIIEWDSLTTLAWQGFQTAEVMLSIAAQQRLLNTLRRRYDTQENLEQFLERACNLGLLRSKDSENPNLLEQPRYFIHFTLQEYLAAYYVVDTLQGYRTEALYRETLIWIAQHKYNPHAAAVMGFIAGISIQPGYEQAFASYWHALLSPPHDLTGLAHLRLMLRCLEEARCDPKIPHNAQLLKEIQQWGKSLLVPKLRDTEVFNGFWRLVSQYPLVCKQTNLIDVLRAAVRDQNLAIQLLALSAFQGMRGELAGYPEALAAVLKTAKDKNSTIREAAIKVLGSMGIHLAQHSEAVKIVLKATNDEHYYIREVAVNALEGMGEKLSQYPEALVVVLKAKEDKDVHAQSVEIQALEDIDANLSLHSRTLEAILHVSSNACHVLQAHWTLYIQNAIRRYLSIEHNDSTFGGRILKSLKGNPRNPWSKNIVHAVSLRSIPFSASLIMDKQTLQIRLDGEKETLALIFPGALKPLIKSITSSYARYQLNWPDYAACAEGKPFYPQAKQPTFSLSVWPKPRTLPSTNSSSPMWITDSKSSRSRQLKERPRKPAPPPDKKSLTTLPVRTESQELLLLRQRQLLDAFLSSVQKMVQRIAILYVPADQRHTITEPQVFFSYAWEAEGTRLKRLQETFLRDTLAKDLRRVALNPWLDIERMVGNMDGQMRDNINDSQYVILIGTQRYAERTSITQHEHRTNVRKELEFTLEQAKKSNDFLLPLLLEGEWGTTFPEISKNYLVFDCRTWFSLEQGWLSFEQYIHGLTQPSPLGILPAVLGMSRLNDYPEYRKALREEYQTLYRNLMLELQHLTSTEFSKEYKKNQSFSFVSTPHNPTLFSSKSNATTEIQSILIAQKEELVSRVDAETEASRL